MGERNTEREHWEEEEAHKKKKALAGRLLIKSDEGETMAGHFLHSASSCFPFALSAWWTSDFLPFSLSPAW